MTLESLGVLALMIAVALASYRAGRDAAKSHLMAAKEVSEVTSNAAYAASSYRETLDKTTTTLASLRDVVEGSTKANAEHARAVEDAILQLFQGFERAGFARAPGRIPRQHGESDNT